MQEYYEARAPEYDDWWLGTGLFEGQDRPGWAEDVMRLVGLLASLPAARTLDVACGTGFLTRHLHGEVVGLDQSPSMLGLARARAPSATFVRCDALALPYGDRAFERVFTSHFYGHLGAVQREGFLREIARVAGELVVVESTVRADVEPEQWQERVLNDGSPWAVFKRYFSPESLAGEIGGETLYRGAWLIVARVEW